MTKMKHLILGLLLSIALISNAQTDLKKYDYSSHNFKISFPLEPVFSVDSSTFNDAPQNTYYWEVNVSDSLHPNIYYSAALTTYPPEFIHSDSLLSVVEGFINSTQNSLIDDEDFTSLSSTLIEVDGYPGKAFKWKNNTNNIFLQFRVFLVENHLYQCSLVSKEGENHNKLINQFFDSFEVLNIPNGNFTIPEISIERAFAIDFPEKPGEQTNVVDSEYGKLYLDIQTLEPKTEDVNLVYVAMETKYPDNAINTSSTYELNKFYMRSIEASMNSVSGELISVHDIYYNENYGKEYRCYFSEGLALMVYRIFFINNRMYSFGVITSPDKAQNKGMSKFLDSFEILE